VENLQYCISSFIFAQRESPSNNGRPIATCSAVESFQWPTFRTSLSVGVFYILYKMTAYDVALTSKGRLVHIPMYGVDVRKVCRVDSNAANYIYRGVRN